VQQELERCNTLDQQILLFSVVDGHSLAEVAKRLGMTLCVPASPGWSGKWKKN
jgi:DNA-directed RNA polymerase specialized sigma24 family protein